MIISINKIEADIKVLWGGWQRCAIRIWRQSKSSFLILAISQILLGSMPYLAVVWFGGSVDAISGARSLGLWTDDVNSSMWVLLGVMVLLCISIFITKQFEGLSASVARGIRWFAFIISALIFLLPVAPFVISIIGLLLVAEIWIEARVRSLIWLAVIGLLCWLEWNLIESIVFRMTTLGEGLSIAVFAILLPIRQFIDRYFVCG